MNDPLLILGAGGSGLAAARLLASRGKGRGWVLAEKPPPENAVTEFQDLGFEIRDTLPKGLISEAVVSPGFAWEHPWLESLRNSGTRIVPEFALGAAELRGRTLAVTGSLGKTSMVLLAAEILRAAGLRVTVSGNIGDSVSAIALREADADLHVMELSSFQLELNSDFRPDAALCLNLFPNHLDRHGTLERYAAAKARLFAFQTPEDIAFWPETYPITVSSRARRVFARPEDIPALQGSPFASGALRENLAALLAVLAPFGLPVHLEKILRAFRFPAYRMQELYIPGAGRVVNDSKSTCLSATLAALETLPGHVHLIVGGLPKNEDLGAIGDVFARRGLSLYLMGSAAEEMRRAWEGRVPYCRVLGDLPGCLEALWSRRRCGEPLLFSPGCASFDQYSGYTERGSHFQRLVETLAARQPL